MRFQYAIVTFASIIHFRCIFHSLQTCKRTPIHYKGICINCLWLIYPINLSKRRNTTCCDHLPALFRMLFLCFMIYSSRICVLFHKSISVYHFLNELSLSYPVLSRMGVHACRTAILLLFSGQYNKIFVDSFALTFPGAWHSSPGRKESTVDDSAILTRLFAPLSVRGQILWKGRIA